LERICSVCLPNSLTDKIGYCHYFCASCEACKPPAGPDPSKCVDNCKGTQSECFCGLWWEEEKCLGCDPLHVCRDKKCVPIFNPMTAAASSSPNSCKQV
jgi:hypothetical protein